MSDPYRSFDGFAWQLRSELGVGFAVNDPRAHIIVPTDRLPEALRPSAEAMHTAETVDERRAAASEFLLLSEEYLL